MKKSIKIKGDQSKTFNYVTHYKNVNFLLDEFLHFEPVSEDVIQIGKTYKAKISFANFNFSIPFLVTEYVSDTVMVLQSKDQLLSRVKWEIMPVENDIHLLCLQVDLDLSIDHSPIFKPFLSLPAFFSQKIVNCIRAKQQSLIVSALIKAKKNLENNKIQLNSVASF